MKLAWIWTVLAIATICSGCPKHNEEQPQEDQDAPASDEVLRPVEVQLASRRDLLHTNSYVADLQPARQVTVLGLVTERIVEMPWEDGDFIQKGEIVARIRQDSFRRSLDQIRAELDALNTQVASQKREVKRTKLLLEGNAATQQALDGLQSGLDATLARRKGLEANQAQMRLTLDQTVVRAPISGVVTHKRVEVGDIAAPQVPLMVIMALDTIKVVLHVAERDVPMVRPDQGMDLRIDAYPGDVFTAHVSRIMPYLQADTRTNTVEAILSNPKDPQTGQHRFKPGMYGRVDLVLDRREGALVVPERALLLVDDLLAHREAGKNLRRIFVIGDGNVARARTLEIGTASEGYSEILAGLEEGEMLVVRGHHGLRDEQKVTIISRGDQGQEAKNGQPISPDPGKRAGTEGDE